MNDRVRAVLLESNPWWRDPKATIPEVKPRRRHAFSNLVRTSLDSSGKMRGTILVGLRQVGKTELAKQVAEEALDRGLPPNQLAVVGVDDPRITGALTIADILEGWRPFRNPGKTSFLVIDEIHKLSDPSGERGWPRQLKGIIDMQEFSVLATGSSAAVLNLGAAEGTGRWDYLELEPLSFREFRELSQPVPGVPPQETVALDLDSYLSVGGFPEFALSRCGDLKLPSTLEKIRAYAEQILAADVPSCRRPVQLRQLFSILMDESGEEQNIQRLATTLNCQRSTIENWIRSMEAAFLIDRVWGRALGKTASVRRDVRGRPKLYARDPSLVSAFGTGSDPLSHPRLRARLFEAATLRHLRELARRCRGRLAFVKETDAAGRPLGEVDFLLSTGHEIFFLEVTSSAGDPKKKSLTVLTKAESWTRKTPRQEVYACVVHGGFARESQATECIPLGTFLEEILGGPEADPCKPLRDLSTRAMT